MQEANFTSERDKDDMYDRLLTRNITCNDDIYQKF